VAHVIALKCEKEKEKEEYTHIYNDKSNSKFNIPHTLSLKFTFKKSTHQGLSNIKYFYMHLGLSNAIGVNTLLTFKIVMECNLRCTP